jgi:hypothetical protein
VEKIRRRQHGLVAAADRISQPETSLLREGLNNCSHPAALADHGDVARQKPFCIKERRGEGGGHRKRTIDDADAVGTTELEAGFPTRVDQRPLPFDSLPAHLGEAPRPDDAM